MKKYLKYLLALILFVPFLVSAQGVSIKTIKLVEKDEFVEELSAPKFEGLKIDFNLKFETVGDQAVYELLLENSDNENYFLNLKVASDSKYILYTVDSAETTNVVSANSSTKVYLVVKYNKEVPNYMLEENKYTEKKSIKISLTNDKGNEVITDSKTKNAVAVNPNTGNVVLKLGKANITISLITVGIVLVLAVIAIVLLKKLRVKRYTNMVIVLALILIPGIVSAIKVIEVEINSNIEIEPVKLIEFKVTRYNIKDDSSKKYRYKAVEGMTWDEWQNSKYNVDNLKLLEDYVDDINNCVEGYYVDIDSIGIMRAKVIPDKVLLSSVIDPEEQYVLSYDDCKYHFWIETETNGRYSEKNYTADLGMTFGEWLDSSYNVDNISFEDGSTFECYTDGGVLKKYLFIYDSYVSYSDTIVSGYYYEMKDNVCQE